MKLHTHTHTHNTHRIRAETVTITKSDDNTFRRSTILNINIKTA